MVPCNLFIQSLLIFILGLHSLFGIGQQVSDVPEAFGALSSEPEIIYINNDIKVPIDGGHLQGVQVIEKNRTEKLLISGSSLKQAYILQVDLITRKTDRLIPLMKEPYRHAGGFQVSEPYIAVGIEDNYAKTTSKVCLYNFTNDNLYKAKPKVTIDRKGEAKRQTAGSTGLLTMDNGFLLVVANWDSRNWDFYHIDTEKRMQKMLVSFTAPDDWASYQSINLIMDDGAIYVIATYQIGLVGYADLIIVSSIETFGPIMEIVDTKTFYCTNGVDFNTAAGLQVDKEGNLHIWGTQREALKQIVVHKFSQQ